MNLPIVSADPWEDDEEPRPGGAQEKFWLKRPDGSRALFKLPRPGEGPHHVNDLVGARLAQAWTLSAPDAQLFQHEVSGWGALIHELPRPYMDFSQLPQAPQILAGADRDILTNDRNVRCMPIFDAVINNQDRGGTHNSMVSWHHTPAGPLLYQHWLTDHGYGFDGNLAQEQLAVAIEAAGGMDRYLQDGRPRLQAALNEASGRWWEATREFCEALVEYDESALNALLTGIPGGLVPTGHLECLRGRILYNRQFIREFVNAQGG